MQGLGKSMKKLTTIALLVAASAMIACSSAETKKEAPADGQKVEAAAPAAPAPAAPAKKAPAKKKK